MSNESKCGMAASGLCLLSAMSLSACSSAPVATYGHPALDLAVAQQQMAQELARRSPTDGAPRPVAGRVLTGAVVGALIGSRFGAPGSQGQSVGVMVGSALGANVASTGVSPTSVLPHGTAPLVGAVIGSRFGKGLGSAVGAVVGATAAAVAEGQGADEASSINDVQK